MSLSARLKRRSARSWAMASSSRGTAKCEGSTLTYDPYHFLRKGLTSDAYTLVSNREVSSIAYDMDPYVYKKDKKMHYWTIGLSFMVNL